MTVFPESNRGRPKRDEYNKRIVELMRQRYGVDRIRRTLLEEGAKIGRGTIQQRMRELRQMSAEEVAALLATEK